jgi:uncharacterized membrane protein
MNTTDTVSYIWHIETLADHQHSAVFTQRAVRTDTNCQQVNTFVTTVRWGLVLFIIILICVVAEYSQLRATATLTVTVMYED